MSDTLIEDSAAKLFSTQVDKDQHRYDVFLVTATKA